MEPFRWGSIQPLGLAKLFSDENDDEPQWAKSPWLVASLGNCLGFQWRVDDITFSVSAERCNVSCADAATGESIHICFLFSGTIEDTLDGLLPQAAKQGTAKLVFVTSALEQEFVEQINWLNQITVHGLSVYGLELDFWQMHQSATVFPLVTAIIDEQGLHHQLTPLSNGVTSSGQQVECYVKPLLPFTEFWLAFNAELIKQKSQIVGQKPSSQSWVSYPIDDSFSIVASLDPAMQSCAVGLIISGSKFEYFYEQLLSMKAAIESELSMDVTWEIKKNRGFCRIFARQLGYDASDRTQWPAVQTWLASALAKFQSVFELKVNVLSLQDRFNAASGADGQL